MNQLTEQLRVADWICTEAYPFFEKAALMRVNAETKAQKEKKSKKTLSIVAGVVFYFLGGSLLMLLLRGLGNLLAFPLAVVFGIYLYKRVFIPRIDSEHAGCMKEADAEEAKGTKILEDNIPSLSVIPNDYWYPLATNYLLKVVQTGRAETVNQALQMFDEQLHRWKIEEANASIVAQQKAQTEALRGIRKSSAINAAANVANAAANISRWF